MVDIFDEISDDLRAERTAALLRRYGGLFIAAAILVLLGVAGNQLWLSYQAKRNNAAAEKFIAITQPVDAQQSLDHAQLLAIAQQLANFANTAPAGYRSLARLRAAALYAQIDRLPQAAAQWDDLSRDSAADPLLRQLANLLWAQHELGIAPNAAVAARLMPLTAPEIFWHGLAQETQALLYLHEGNTEQAKALFSQIASDPSAPEGVRNRADGLLAQLNG